MGYVDTLQSWQKRNIDQLIDTMDKLGIRDDFTQASVLAVISKESAFRPQAERSYKNTSADRIKSIFGKYINDLTTSEIDQLKQDDVAFFNKVYGGRYGNASNEGYKFRGRGYNQLTFKSNYKSLSDQVGIDLVSDPDKLADPKIASKVAVKYFLSRFKSGFDEAKQYHYNADHINDFTNVVDSTLAVYHANAGFNKPLFTVSQATSTGGLEKALDRAPDLLKYVEDYHKKKNESES